MKGEGTGHPGDGQDPQDLLPRRGQQEIPAAAAGVPGGARQRGQAAAVDVLQAGQVHDDRPRGPRSRREGGSHTRGVRYVKPAAQGGDGQAVALADPQVHATHCTAFRNSSKAGSGPGWLVGQLPVPDRTPI
jgi:hypothetical protein